MIKLSNVFSPTMVDGDKFTIHFEKLYAQEAYEHLLDNGFVSTISSREITLLFSDLLGIKIDPAEKQTILMSSGDQMILGLYSGPKLFIKNGKIIYPNQYRLNWYLITID